MAATANSLPYDRIYSVSSDPLTPTREATIRSFDPAPAPSNRRRTALAAVARVTRRLRAMGRVRQTRAKRGEEPEEPDEPEEAEDPEEPEDDDEQPDLDAPAYDGSDNDSLFSHEEEEQDDDGAAYDENADKAAPAFNQDDNPKYRDRELALTMFMEQLKFNRLVALTLYRDEGLVNASSILRLKDDTIDRMMSAIRKEDPTLVIPIPAVENLKLLVYYLKHRQRTSRLTTGSGVLLPNTLTTFLTTGTLKRCGTRRTSPPRPSL